MSIKRVFRASTVGCAVAALSVTAYAQFGIEEDTDQQQDEPAWGAPAEQEQEGQQPQPQQPQQQEQEPAPAPAPAPGAGQPGLGEAPAVEGANITEASAEEREAADVVVGVLNLQDVARAYNRLDEVRQLADPGDDGAFWLDAGGIDDDPIDSEMIDTAREEAAAVADEDVDMVVAEHLDGQPENVAMVDLTEPLVDRLNEQAEEYEQEIGEAGAAEEPLGPIEQDEPVEHDDEPEPLPGLPEQDEPQDDGADDGFGW